MHVLFVHGRAFVVRPPVLALCVSNPALNRVQTLGFDLQSDGKLLRLFLGTAAVEARLNSAAAVRARVPESLTSQLTAND